MNSKQNSSKYVISVVVAGILWGLISIFVKSLTRLNANLFQILTMRAVLSTIILFFFLLIKDKSLLKIKLKDIWMFVGTGIISFTFFSLCYFFTILESGASVAVVLLYTSPIFVLLISAVLFHEKITVQKMIALVLTFVGCVLTAGFLGSTNAISVKGFIIGLCGGLGYALYSIFSRFALKKYDILTIIFYTFLFSAIILVPFVFLPFGNFASLKNSISFELVLSTLGIVIFGTVLPYLFYTFGLKGLETSRAAILVTIEPLIGTLLGLVAYQEPCSIEKIIGILLIFISLILCGIQKKK